MNIAIVTDSYYPNMSAAASCMDKFIQKLKHKHSFTIINMLNQCEYADLDDEAIVVYPVSSLLWRWRIKCKDNIKSGKHVFINNLAINLFRIRSLFMTPYAYPSPIRWSLKAFYNGLEKLHLQKQFDAVISVSDPICCSFAAKEFKKKHPEVKWIGYYTDPFTFQPSKYRQVPFKKHRWKKNFYNEKEAYDTADFNLFTEEIYKLALTEFKQPVSKTFKMKFGHRGGNHPVKNLETGKLEITSQNHSYAVDVKSLDGTDLELTHVNLLDDTAEGVKCEKDKLFSVQYHPESAPGPQDSAYLFDEFIALMQKEED